MTPRQARGKGLLFVISAPSGAGKSTLCRQLLRRVQGMKLSVSHTTRAPRKGEVNNVDYTFVTEKKFRGMIAKKEFAEWAVVHGNLYGTSIRQMKKMMKQGYDIIFDIDVHGAMQLKKVFPGAVFIFILPPSMAVLKKRLRKRNTDTRETIVRRLQNARDEISFYRDYDYVIVNAVLQKAYRELESIIIAARMKTEFIDDKKIKKIFH